MRGDGANLTCALAVGKGIGAHTQAEQAKDERRNKEQAGAEKKTAAKADGRDADRGGRQRYIAYQYAAKGKGQHAVYGFEKQAFGKP